MQVPIRKNDKIPRLKIEAKITLEKFNKLRKTLDFLKNKIRPIEIKEVKELSTTGDYSENAGYQEAKHKLRLTNNKIDKIEDLLSRAEIIEIKNNSEDVEIGSTVELECEGKIKKYQILGSLETNPSQGCISYNSPLGSALLGKKIGDKIKIKINNYSKEYKIIKII